MALRRSVALLIETSNAYSRGLLQGVLHYIRSHEPWSLLLPEQERGAPPPGWLSRWKGDGVIARVENKKIARAVAKLKIPVVNVSAAQVLADTPWVETNDQEIARLAFEHLFERGFQSLGFCGDPGFNWSRWRRQHFESLVKEAGLDLYIHEAIPRNDEKYSWNRERKRLLRWVNKLPKPIGVFACYDIKAQQLLDICRELEVAVPEQLAVLGVDDDELVCEISSPPLSSVTPNTRRTGFEAARLLAAMMNGQRVSAEAYFIDPIGVRVRQSTDVLAIEDEDVATAVRYIRENAWSGINVVDVLREVPLSRRVLEHRFRQILGRTPHEEIMRLRMNRVREMLAETDLPLAEIAYRCGFEHSEYLSVSFKRETGKTPLQYRRSLFA